MPPHLVYVGTYTDPSSQAGYEVTPERPVMGTTGTELPRDPLPLRPRGGRLSGAKGCTFDGIIDPRAPRPGAG